MKLSKKNIGTIIILFCAVLVYLLAEVLLGCPFKKVFGISCPGCGLTRASLAALSGDLPWAFALHPLFPVPYAAALIGIIYFFARKKTVRIICASLLILLLFLFLSVYVIRLVLYPSTM